MPKLFSHLNLRPLAGLITFILALANHTNANQNIRFNANATGVFAYMKESDTQKQVLVQNAKGQIIYTSDPNEWALYPDISSDAKTLLYVAGKDENSLYLKIVDLQNKQEFSWKHLHAGLLLQPKFSKNKKFIFYSAANQNKYNQIYYFAFKNIESLFSQRPELQTLNTDQAFFPRPSSDANFIVYQRNSLPSPSSEDRGRSNLREVVLFDRLSGQTTVIDKGMSPNLSVDETRIVYTKKDASGWNIYSYNRVLKTIEQLTDYPGDEMAPVLDADFNLYFSANHDLSLSKKSSHSKFRIFKKYKNSKTELFLNDESADFYALQISGETQYQQAFYADMSGQSRSSFASAKWGDQVFVCGGHQGAEHTYPEESFVDRCSVLNLKSNQWHEIAPRPAKAHGFQMIAYNGFLYAFGGFAFSSQHKPKWKSLDSVDRYDIANNKWERIGQMPRARSSNQAVFIEDKVYLIGGWDSTPKFEGDYDGVFHAAIDVFDLKTQSFSRLPVDLKAPLRRAFTAIAYQDKILLLGGLGEGASHFTLLNHFSVLDSKSLEWQEWPELAFGTFAPGAGIINDEVFVFGGMFKTGNMEYEYVSHIYAYHIPSKKWRHSGRYVSETKGFSQVLNVSESELMVLGGHHYSQNEDRPVLTCESFRR